MTPVAVAALPATAWRNGRGRTRELAVSPADATLESFDWRVSLAELEPGTCAFSAYPGVDRVLVPAGHGLRLAGVALAPWVAASIAGEAPVDALLDGGAMSVFNVMARRGRARGAAAVHRRSVALAADATSVLWCVRGRARLERAGDSAGALAAGDAAVVPREAGAAAHLHLEDADTLVVAATLHG